jgi:hypothetical protein
VSTTLHSGPNYRGHFLSHESVGFHCHILVLFYNSNITLVDEEANVDCVTVTISFLSILKLIIKDYRLNRFIVNEGLICFWLLLLHGCFGFEQVTFSFVVLGRILEEQYIVHTVA